MNTAKMLASTLMLLSCGEPNRDVFEQQPRLTPSVDSGVTPDCVETLAETKRAVDIIVSVDRSSSMRDEIEALKENINLLPPLLTESGLDYRVIMVAEVGRGLFNVCVPPPLGGEDCESNGNIFRAVNQHIESWDTLVNLVRTLDHPVPKLAWRDFLRPGVLKVFVPMTDDNSVDMDATTFDVAIRGRGEPLFGTETARNYAFFPIIGALDFPNTSQCPTASNEGVEYQHLARLTNGRWFSVCRPSLREVLEEIGKAITVAAACEVAVPPPPLGTTLDLTKVNVRIGLADRPSVVVPQDPTRPCDGGADGWQFSADGTKILLCGDACNRVRSASATKFTVGFGCNALVR